MGTDTRNRQGQSHEQPVHRTHQPRDARDDARRGSTMSYSPFALMRQGIDEMDRWFTRLTGSSGSMSGARDWMPSSSPRDWMASATGMGDWSPAIEAFQRGSEFVVRADVPGMTRHELNVEVGDDLLTISGERKSEQQRDENGMFWTERTYGSFSRTIPLPPGAIADSAKATFNNGVLEVVVQAPSQEARRGRKIDISGQGADTK